MENYIQQSFKWRMGCHGRGKTARTRNLGARREVVLKSHEENREGKIPWKPREGRLTIYKAAEKSPRVRITSGYLGPLTE